MVVSDRRGRDEGFSILELAITMMLSGMVFSAIVGILISQTNAERSVSAFVANHEEIRQAMVEIQRDLRSAEPLIAAGATSNLKNQLDLKMYDDVTSVTPFHVRWRLDTVNNELVRELIATDGTVTGTTYRVRGSANGVETVPVPLFTYYRANGQAYVLDDPGVTPGDVAYCTVRVAIDLRANPNDGRNAVRLVSDVQLRNKLPGADECPR